MSKKTRRHHTPDQKINVLRRHHLDKVAVSKVCESAELQPSVFYPSLSSGGRGCRWASRER